MFEANENAEKLFGQTIDLWKRFKESLGGLLMERQRYLGKVAHDEGDDRFQQRERTSDFVQDTYLIAVKNFFAFNGNSLAEFDAWLIGVLKNKVDEAAKRNLAVKRSVQEEREFQELGKQNSLHGKMTVADLLARLPEELQNVAHWKMEGHSNREISEKLGCSEESVRLRVERIKERLKPYLEND